jgi:hypothetical protein
MCLDVPVKVYVLAMALWALPCSRDKILEASRGGAHSGELTRIEASKGRGWRGLVIVVGVVDFLVVPAEARASTEDADPELPPITADQHCDDHSPNIDNLYIICRIREIQR